MSSTVSKEHAPDRFQIAADGIPAGATFFVDHDGHRVFFHTEVLERFEGRGLAATLVADALDATRAEGLRVMPVCPYVQRYLTKHHQHDDIVDPVTPAAIAALPDEPPEAPWDSG
jgi:predicted GNAT family acetyltransferase